MLSLYQSYYYYYDYICDREETKKYATKALELAQKIYSNDTQEFVLVSEIYMNMGYVCYLEGDTLGYLNHCLKAIDIVNEHAPLEKSTQKAHLANVYQRTANCYSIMDIHNNALEYYLKAIEIYDELYKKNPYAYCLNYGKSILELAYTYYNKDETEEVVKCENKALEILKIGFGQETFFLFCEDIACYVYLLRGLRHIDKENYEEALIAWKEILKLNPDYLKECQKYDDIPKLYTVLKEKGLVE